MQSPRKLAHSCWRLVVQLSLSASSLSVPRRGHPRCHKDPGSLLDLSLLGAVSPLFDSFLEASRAPSGTAHEEYSLQVSLSPRPLSTPSVPIALCSRASSAQFIDPAFCCSLRTIFSTCLDLPPSGAYFWSSRPATSSYFSVHRSSHPDLAWVGSSEPSVLLSPFLVAQQLSVVNQTRPPRCSSPDAFSSAQVWAWRA